jgi:hypothetical protein
VNSTGKHPSERNRREAAFNAFHHNTFIKKLKRKGIVFKKQIRISRGLVK